MNNSIPKILLNDSNTSENSINALESDMLQLSLPLSDTNTKSDTFKIPSTTSTHSITRPVQSSTESTQSIQSTQLIQRNNEMFPMIGGPQRAFTTGPGIRRKVGLLPGYSPLDWARLKSSNTDMRAGITQLQRFTKEDLALHKSKTDMWMSFRGKVYNVTPYVSFHPGGSAQLMRGAGKDITELFLKIHPWVNIDMVLDKCWIGYLI
ncbi:Fe-S cluster-binding ribosome biosynthesis protein [Batrachochytrium dendrobatidis]